jgi:ubiquitin C-terminal hydrolase
MIRLVTLIAASALIGCHDEEVNNPEPETSNQLQVHNSARVDSAPAGLNGGQASGTSDSASASTKGGQGQGSGDNAGRDPSPGTLCETVDAKPKSVPEVSTATGSSPSSSSTSSHDTSDSYTKPTSTTSDATSSSERLSPRKPKDLKKTSQSIGLPEGAQEAGARGLVNLGATCYMNSLLQVLMHMDSMRALISGVDTDKTLLREMRILFDTEWQAGQPIIPKAIFDQLAGINGELFSNKQQDVHEAFVALGAALDFDIFSFDTVTALSCDGGSKFTDIRTESQTALLLPLPAQEPPANLADLVKDYFVTEIIDVAERCNDNYGLAQTRLVSGPQVLVLSLHRNVYNQPKIHTPVSFQERIDGSMFPGLEKSTRYRLIGVVYHDGATVKYGHYTASVKKGTQWLHANDQSVTPLEQLDTTSTEVTTLFYELEK